MASPQAEALNIMYRSFRERNIEGRGPLDLGELRRDFEALAELTAEPDGVNYTSVRVGDIDGLWVDPDRAALDRVIVHLHGGGYTSGSIQSHRKLVGHLARSVGCRALVVGYRLAPEHPYPAPLEDATAAVDWLVAQGIETSHIAFCGDSAGGGLAVATLLKLRDHGRALPAGCVLFSPAADFEFTAGSIKSRADLDLIFSEDVLTKGRDQFLNGWDTGGPFVSPVYASLVGLPPLYIQVGDHEVLLDDSTRLASNAERDGVEVRLDIVPEMQHVFQMSAGNMPEADDALHRAGDWLRRHLGLGIESPSPA